MSKHLTPERVHVLRVAAHKSARLVDSGGRAVHVAPEGRLELAVHLEVRHLDGVLAVADVLSQLSIPIFWALHHPMQPAVLKGCSIALVNSIGNGVGGFFGPFLLGAMHDAFSAAVACRGTKHASARIAVCTGQWGPGTVLVGLATLPLVTAHVNAT